ncbi:putative late blight resistance protein homolog R1C-3 [Lycium ferocissimum]|uniref:putative late blight resistance protein homolog R1C-3 n=1 Tax=Lycium ferocissimum TaxID=112874 RepID=UPI002814F844|nr:putative late blight resistance protein homolog R1C-3 [Lycium ferocissimum]
MLNILRANLINLPLKVFLFHLQHINSAIVDAGILVCSLTDVGETYQALALDFSGNIQSIQAVIYLITRKSFFLQTNLTRTDGLDTTDFSFDNLKGLLSFYSDSIVSVQSQIRTIQNELKCFQADVEKQDELQHFAADVIGLAYEVEHIYDACK